MNRIAIVSLVLVLIFLSNFAKASVYQVGVDGLACPFCAYGIEKQLHKLAGVKSVTVDVAAGVVFVEMEDNKVLEREATGQAVKKAGFDIRSFDKVSEVVREGAGK